MKQVRSLAFVLVTVSLAACASLQDGTLAVQSASAEYHVTVYNLTSGQPFTPPLFATHQGSVSLFSVGAVASEGVREIAENGNLGPALAALGASAKVDEVFVAVAGDPPPLMPGASVSFDIGAARGARFVSFASMLICTNDGFTGLDSLKLPERIGESVEVHAGAYDAGSEINTEDFADIVPPCQALVGVSSEDPGTGTSNPDLAQGGVIAPHPGILGGNDLLTEVHGWTDPVAKIVIERVE